MIVTGAARIPFAIHKRQLSVHLLAVPVTIDAGAEVRRGQVAIPVEGNGPLHAVIPERLRPIDVRRVDQAELVRELAVVRRPAEVGVLQAHLLIARSGRRDVEGDPRLESTAEPADGVDIGPLDRKLILVPGAEAVLELIEVLPIDNPAYGE